MCKNKTKKVILIGLLSVSWASHAMSTVEICQWRGKMVAAIAKERDKGISQGNVVDYVYKQFGKNGVKRSTIHEYASAVYSRRDVSPEVFYQLGELSCLQEFNR